MTCHLSREHEIHARYAPWDRAVELFLFDQSDHRRRIQFEAKVLADDAHQSEPSLSLNEITPQRLMDQLWNCGFRPIEGSGSAGSLAATQRHLEDMRTIALNTLRINENGPQVSKVAR